MLIEVFAEKPNARLDAVFQHEKIMFLRKSRILDK